MSGAHAYQVLAFLQTINENIFINDDGAIQFNNTINLQRSSIKKNEFYLIYEDHLKKIAISLYWSSDSSSHFTLTINTANKVFDIHWILGFFGIRWLGKLICSEIKEFYKIKDKLNQYVDDSNKHKNNKRKQEIDEAIFNCLSQDKIDKILLQNDDD